MTSVTTPSPATNDDASLGRTIRNIVFVGSTLFAVFYAGAFVGETIRKESAAKIEALEKKVDEADAAEKKKVEDTYVRKDGGELAQIRAQLTALNEKMDYMIRQRAR